MAYQTELCYEIAFFICTLILRRQSPLLRVFTKEEVFILMSSPAVDSLKGGGSFTLIYYYGSRLKAQFLFSSGEFNIHRSRSP